MKSEPAPAAKSGGDGKSGNYSSAAEKMMAMMGYKSGRRFVFLKFGLGSQRQYGPVWIIANDTPLLHLEVAG